MIRVTTLPQLAGTAAGTVVSAAPVVGGLLAAFVAHDSAGTLTLQTVTSPAQTLLTVAAGTQWYYPRVQIHDVGGTAIASQYDVLAIDDYVQASLDAAGTASVVLMMNRPD